MVSVNTNHSERWYKLVPDDCTKDYFIVNKHTGLKEALIMFDHMEHVYIRFVKNTGGQWIRSLYCTEFRTLKDVRSFYDTIKA